MTVSETERRAFSIAKKIPMTRLADLGPLDRSRPHVFGAVTPLARDLTTHLGKGLTAAAARVSALMEAIERASAEETALPELRMSFNAMATAGHTPIDPTRFTLPPKTTFDPDRDMHWTPAQSMPQGQAVFLPRDLVVSPPIEQIILQPDTNGLASGNTVAEAALHAICELVERDALGKDMFARLFGDAADIPPVRRIDPVALPKDAKAVIDRAEAAGFSIALFDYTSNIALPVIAAYLTDYRYPGPNGPHERSFFGYGCSPAAGKALARALTEAEQSRVCILQGARDSFNFFPARATPSLTEGDAVPFDTVTSAPPSDDLLEDLDYALSALNDAGFQDVYLVDLTDPRLGLPVVRVRVPGLSVFMVDQSRVGSRDLTALI